MMELDSEDEAPGAVEVPALPARRVATKVKAKAVAAAEVEGEAAAAHADPAGPPVQNPGDPEVRGFVPKPVFFVNGDMLTACLGSHAACPCLLGRHACLEGMVAWKSWVLRSHACLVVLASWRYPVARAGSYQVLTERCPGL